MPDFTPPATAIDAMNCMKTELRSRGWTKGVFEGPDGALCLAGAKNLALYGNVFGHGGSIDPVYRRPVWEMSSAISNAIKEVAHQPGVVLFNDAVAHDLNEVIEAIDKAIALLEEEAQHEPSCC